MAGIAVLIDVDKDLQINDVNQDMARVSAQMAFWGDVQASAQEELTALDGHYRHWRANLSKEILKREEKVAEWKIKAEIESSKDFLAFKLKQANLEKNILIARSQFDSYRQKASLLQSKGANMRANIDAPTSSSSESTPPSSMDDADDEVEPDEELEISDVGIDPRLAKMKSGGFFRKGKK